MRRLMTILLCALLLVPAASAEDMPAPGRLPDAVLHTYYDGSLFVGDSLVDGFRGFTRGERSKGRAFRAVGRFFAADRFALHSASTERLSGTRSQLRFNGYDVTLAWIMGRLQPRRVFILAGLNDDIHIHVDRADRYIDRIMALRDSHSPGTEICFFSLVPVSARVGPKRQREHDAYNDWLREKCAQVGAVFVDIASGLKGGDGFLPAGFCSDGRYHLNRSGNTVWARELLDFAQSRYEAGLWDPQETD